MENTDFKFVSEEKCREIQSNLKCKIVKNNTFELEDIRYIPIPTRYADIATHKMRSIYR
ncbi:hypothetical protein [Clostridium saccharoperbutylacetonicum]|uniref:hypothetical protein n=1 Tax=Clostridium saccharoperbutylacetonicum TaxID=36745 RepID=UPI0039E7DDC4